MKNLQGCYALVTIAALGAAATARAQGVQPQLRSSAALIPPGTAGAAAPTAPAGAVVVGAQTWVCDASQGFARVITVADPVLAIGVPGVHLPISPTTVPATCGQMTADATGNVYVTQAVVDTTVTPSIARGVLRESLDPITGDPIGSGTYIATTAGLDGNQPTAAAIGPDGNLYVAFLKNGNIKRVLRPAAGTTQVVQSVGNTPNGHAARALAFAGNDLYVASIDAFSVIRNAVSTACTGGCNAAPIADGFPGVPHVGVTSDGSDTVYFSVATYNQVWRYTPATGLFNFIAQNFSFVPSKTNLLTLDAGGTLWIGDDPGGATTVGAGRLWTVSAGALAGVTGGSPIAGTNTQAIANVLRGPWSALVQNTLFTPTFNADGTFTATIQPPSGGVITTDSGTWTLTPPVNPSTLGNPQGHLSIVDANGVVLLEGDVLLIKADQIAMMPATSGVSQVTTIGLVVLNKMTA